jgi:hypothetical protein
MSWASATVVRVSHRRERAAGATGAPGEADEVKDMVATLSGTVEFRNYKVSKLPRR